MTERYSVMAFEQLRNRFGMKAAAASISLLSLLPFTFSDAAHGQDHAVKPVASGAAHSISLSPQPSIAPIIDRGPHQLETHTTPTGETYEILRMHHPRSKEDAAMGPLLAANQPGKLVIVNYSQVGDPISDRQRNLIESFLPGLAKQSKRPVLFIDVVALRNDPVRNVADPAFMQSLMVDLKFNKFGPDGTTVPYDMNKLGPLIPYADISYDGEKQRSLSYLQMDENAPEKERGRALLYPIYKVMVASNHQLEGQKISKSGPSLAPAQN